MPRRRIAVAVDRGAVPSHGVESRTALQTVIDGRLYQIVWSGSLDRQGRCGTLVDPDYPRPSTLDLHAVTVYA